MILHTGGVASGDTSTKSNPSSSDIFNASRILSMPSCLPEEDITLTSLAVILSLVLKLLDFFALEVRFKTIKI